MAESVFARMWNAVKPPPPVERRDAPPRFNKKQKRLLWVTLLGIALIAAGWSTYSYHASAPQRAALEFQAGLRLMEPGNYQKAVPHFNRALEIVPGQADVYYSRGVAHRLSNEYDQALADFEQAIALNPSNPAAYIGIGSIYRARGDQQHAMELYTRSLNIRPNVDAFYERGQTFESLGEHQKAIDDYNRAIEELRDAPAVYRARALARRNLGDEAGYLEDRDKARAIEHR